MGESVSLMGEESFQPLLEKGAILQQSVTLPLIIRGSGPSLLGRNWLTTLRLDWQKIFQVKTARSLQEVLDTYTEVFEEKFGKVKGATAKIYIEPDATLWLFKAQSVPFAMQRRWRRSSRDSRNRV